MATSIRDLDKGFKKFFKNLKGLDDLLVKVGIPADLGVINITPTLDLAGLAMVHEFGTKDGVIPERRFLRDTLDINRKLFESLLRKAAKNVVKNKANPKAELFVVSQKVRNKVINRIRLNRIQPKSKKASGITLFDTGRLVGSIQGRVEPK